MEAPVIPIDELATVPAFDGFDERALRAVGAMMRIISADSGEEILGQGARTGGAFIVLEGTVRVVRQVSDQRSVDLGVHERGSLFGLLACIDGEPAALVSLRAAQPAWRRSARGCLGASKAARQWRCASRSPSAGAVC